MSTAIAHRPVSASPAPRTPAAPSTPAAQTVQTVQQPTPTGSWKHPQLDQILKRQYATTFDESNVRTIVMNGSCLAASYVLPSSLGALALLRNVGPFLAKNIPYNTWIIFVVRALFVYNIVQALLPLARRYRPDDITDIPLTPSQRLALGLDPNVSTPQTLGSAYASPQYITPPRYQKSTPRSSFGTPNSASPLSGSPRASLAKSTSNSPFSPNTGSPLFQKAVGGGSATRRLSYDNRGSPGFGASSSLFGESNSPGTPTPGTGKASVSLNNKWLYEKRRDSPRSSLYGSLS